jgi:ATP-binding cassette subfamily B protein
MAADYVSGRMGFLCSNIFFDMFRPVIVLFATFLIIAYQSPLLAFVLFLISLPIFLIERFRLPKIHKLMILRGKAERIYTGFLGDSLANFKLVRYLGSFFTEHLKGYALLKNYLRTTYHAENKRNFYILSADLSEGFFFIFGYVVILYFTATDNLSLGTAFFAFTSLHELSHLFECINRSLSNLTEISGNMATHLELLYKPITVCDKPDAKPLCLKENSISFENVCFGYTSGRPVFKNLNLKISPNQKVGLVGQSGAGKSSFINLILRNHLPTSGEIFLGTQSIADIAGYTLHKNIAVVPQDVTLFNRSLYENLQIANPKASKEEIVEACKLAHIHDVIMALPQGYDTCVGERGILLSGGERQRIAIARAILQNAPILILDEATSALDSESEVAIQDALENLIKNKTVISIAHRLSTLRQMDRILVLDNGKIIEDGSPNALLHRKNSLFNHFYKLQTNGYISEENN